MKDLVHRARTLELLARRHFWWALAGALWSLGLLFAVSALRLGCAAFR